MRYRIGMILLAGSVVVGCQRSGDSNAGEVARMTAGDTSSSEQMPAGHEQHLAQGGGPENSAAGETNAVDHAALGHGGTTTAGGSTLSAPDAAHPAGHSETNAAPQGAMAGMNHTGPAAAQHTSSTAQGAPATDTDHAAHAAPLAASEGGVTPAAAHAQHASEAVQTSAPGATPMVMARPAPEAGRSIDLPAPAFPSDEKTARLLSLVRELVRDSLVQRQIQEDPALREAWSNPAVREVILQQP